MRCKRVGRYGLGGLTSWSNGGAQSSFAPHPSRDAGDVSRFDVYYLAQPHGGKIRIRVDRGEKVIVDTRADEDEDRVYSVEVEPGQHELEVRASGSGRVRLYGVVLERDRPGVVWDSMEMVGAFTNRLSAFDVDHLRSQLESRKTDLAVFTYGGNDMIRDMKMSTYVEEYRNVIQKVKEAKPDIACLVMAPLDHGERKGVRIVSRPIVPAMVQAQREAAKAEGCAFFDTWAAMGGDGSAGRWFRREPKLMGGDLGHATGKGHQVIGELFYRAMLEAYVAYRTRTSEAEQ
jgi:lysophospholipase L1-like esterase